MPLVQAGVSGDQLRAGVVSHLSLLALAFG